MVNSELMADRFNDNNDSFELFQPLQNVFLYQVEVFEEFRDGGLATARVADHHP
jgi:hypothetical protein